MSECSDVLLYSYNSFSCSVQCDTSEIPGDCGSLLTLHCQDLQKCPAPGLLGVQHVSQGWKSAYFCVCRCAGVCVQSSRRLTHCCYASYEWLKCVLGLNVSWGVTSGERHLCLPASLRTSITIGWTCGAWLVAIKDYITVASIYTAEQGRTAAACSSLQSVDLIGGSSHLPVVLYQSRLVVNERADASCQGYKGLLLCCCLWMWLLIFTLVFHCRLTHSSDIPAGYYREIKLCLTCIGLLGFMKELSWRRDAKWLFCYALVETRARTH